MSEHKLNDFPHRAFDKIRYGDTDRQGHINNAVFTTYLETGRVDILFNTGESLALPDCEFVIAHLALDFLGEMHWPGTIDIGSRVAAVGRTSITLEQGLFQNDRCSAFAKSVVVQLNTRTRQSTPLSDSARAQLMKFALPESR